MGEKTIFKRILDGEVPADVVYEDEQCMAFRDVSPQAPTHVLVIPRREIPSLAEVSSDDASLLGHLITVATRLARQLDIAESGFRLVINCGADGGQSVDHLHVHLLGGRALSWPPG